MINVGWLWVIVPATVVLTSAGWLAVGAVLASGMRVMEDGE